MHEPRELDRLARRDDVAVHHVQRIAGLPHVQPRQRTPRPADRVERAIVRVAQQRRMSERLADDLLGLLHGFLREVLQRQAPERQRHAVPRPMAVDVRQFERAAAEIAHDPVGPIHAGHDAEGRQRRLAPAGQHLDVLAADALGRVDEIRTVLGVAARSGRDAPQPLHAGVVAERAEPEQRFERLLDRIGREQAGRLHLSAEAGENLLVEDRGRRARQPLVDDEANRVRSDVDDGDRGTVVEAALRGGRARHALTRARGGA